MGGDFGDRRFFLGCSWAGGLSTGGSGSGWAAMPRHQAVVPRRGPINSSGPCSCIGSSLLATCFLIGHVQVYQVHHKAEGSFKATQLLEMIMQLSRSRDMKLKRC